MEIRKFDYQLLSALESDPLMSFSDLSKILGMSWPTIKKRYNELMDNNILYVPIADYVPEKLGLQRINIFAMMKDIKSLEIVEQACREHPHTVYRSRWITDSFGLFIQFNIPDGTINHLKSFFDIMIENSIVTSYKLYPSNDGRIYCPSDLERYDIIKEEWDFDWDKWLSMDVPQSIGSEFDKEPILSDFTSFKPVHFEILKELTKNASYKQADLMKMLNLSRTDVSRHYNYVINNFIYKIRVNYDFSKFNIYNIHMIVLSNLDKEQIDKLKYNFKTHPPPFRSSFDVCDNSILIWALMDRPHSVDFAYSFWKKFPDMKYYFLSSLAGGAANYQFYPPNFDFKKQDWKRSREYMVDEPFERLQDYIERMIK